MTDQADETGLDTGGEAEASHTGRWQLIRDAFVFQLKLLVDGLRDLVFAPISIVLALIDLVTGGQRYYRLLDLGRRSEEWINLFGRYHDEGHGIDEAVKKIEVMVADQYEKGGMTATAKHSVDKALDKLSRDTRNNQA